MKPSFGQGRFEVVRALGSGGMGEVYEVLDREQRVRLALKQLRDVSAESLLRLKAEFRAVRDLNHANLVSLGELVVEAGMQSFFTMELVEGTDFLGYVRPHLASPAPGPTTQRPPDSATVEIQAPDVLVPSFQPILKTSLQGALVGAPRVEGALEGLDVPRLRDALRQLAEALLALHSAGMVHRDVKPPNIRVTPSGRVVLLDFGLTTPKGSAPRGEGMDRVAGTPLYMAPEQIQAAQAGPPADWYALGMLLYHALLGRPPLTGNVKDIFLYKLRFELEPPAALIAGVPEDLNALCVALLKRAPEERPEGPDVLERLGGRQAERRHGVPTSSAAPGGAPFVGRENELALLREAFAQLRDGKPVTVVLQGDSGLGKTALARAFLEELARDPSAPLILTGRSHERESLPYKALDGVVDGLAEFLGTLPADEVARLTPVHAALLRQAFPVLGRLPSFASEPAPPPGQLAAGEQRRRVFAALRVLLEDLAKLRPLVLFLDDLQWADADSLAALRALFHPPGSPALLAVVTARGPKEHNWVPPPPYGLAALGPRVQHVRIEPLSEGRTLELLERLMPQGARLLSERAQALAAESGGHPLFVQELLLHLDARDAQDASGFQLDEALWSRALRLPLAPRMLLNIVAVAGRPLPNEVLADAAGLAADEYAQAVTTLRQGKLVRALGLRREDKVEHFHDRIRESVLAHLAPAQRRDVHRRIAEALELRRSADAETLAIHWQGAGDLAAASRYASEAAAQADAAFALERAVRLRRLALNLAVEPTAEQRCELKRRLGEALTRAGKNAEAAVAFHDASEDAPPFEAVALRGLAAERYLLAGHLEKGLPELKATLAAVDIPWRTASYATLASIVGTRLQLKWKGPPAALRTEAEVPRELLQQVDALGASSASLGFIDVIAASYYNARYLLSALEAREPRRLARGYALEYALFSALNPKDPERAEQLLGLAERFTQQSNDTPEVRAFILLQRTINAFTRDADLPRTLALSTQAERLLREHCAGAAWELTALAQFANSARYYMGAWSEMRASVLQNLAEAEDRGDSYGIACASTAGINCTWLMGDEPEEARRRIENATARYPRQPTYVIHFYEVLARVNLALYVGDAPTAHRLIEDAWDPIRGIFIMHAPVIHFIMWDMRGRAALALAAERTGSERQRLLGLVRRCAANVARARFGWGRACAETLRAGADVVRGDGARALQRLAVAEAAFEAGEATLLLQLARLRRGHLLGGEEGTRLAQGAAEALSQEGIVAPSKIATLFMPGFSPRG